MPIYDRPVPRYRDRQEAGTVLASQLSSYRGQHTVALAIPNGGVPVAAVIAGELDAELYLVIVRKLQIPDNPEAGFGALTSDGHLMLNHKLIDRLGLTEADVSRQKEKALQSIRSRQEYFGNRAEIPPLNGRTTVIVDDGLASGFTMEAAIASARTRGAGPIVVAVPTSSRSAYRRVESKADRMVCPDVSRLPIFAVADAYRNWYDVDEEEVSRILETW